MIMNSYQSEENRALQSIQRAEQNIANARRELEEIQRRRSLPQEPNNLCDTFSMNVRFECGGKTYKFLLIRAGGKWYTTGTTPQTKLFRDWNALVNWVRQETVGEVTLTPIMTEYTWGNTNTAPALVRLSHTAATELSPF